ncbi:hypothetical protein Srubr_20130 [Streptomyces rubradiris]|uniref:XRE family transcriptional regulator n=1 Tax=Streptomyces rubradiris TaxID=285531 RepID=A0ABQ3R8K6_STRRR|nr:hypothetical protein GCM10018792_59870 [Streptomyces rubradiris]GHI52167.1 hypothetical protein Srubr_20130 [Streptomyces rubradiris]
MNLLLTRARGATQVPAERLGVSRRTLERYRAGALTTPQNRRRAALVYVTHVSAIEFRFRPGRIPDPLETYL